MSENVVLSGLFVCALLWALWRVFVSKKSSLDNLPGPPSVSFLIGNLGQFYHRQGWGFHHDLASKYGPVVRFAGLFGSPTIYVSDSKALQSILVKDQHSYEETHMMLQTYLVTFGPGLLATRGDHHRKQRKLLNPAFSTNHMRYLLPTFYRVTDNLRQAIASQVHEGPKNMNLFRWFGRTALELIGQGGLGHSFDTLVEDKPSAFHDTLDTFLPSLLKLTILRLMTYRFFQTGPPAWRRAIVDAIPFQPLQDFKKVVDVMSNKSVEIYNAKMEALRAGDEAVEKQLSAGKDIISILIKANTETTESERLPDEELIAQMSTMIIAGMDTTCNMLCRIFHLLATHQEVQTKLRQDIKKTFRGQSLDLSYNELMEIPYLDALIRETLRLYPPAMILPRETQKDTVLPLSTPIRGRDGSMIHEIVVPSGTEVMIGVLGSNCNEALWGKDAYEWKPERWLSPLPSAVTDAHIPGVYSNLMSFNGGARSCIGLKFSELEMKSILCTLLSSFKFDLPDSAEPIMWNISGVNYPSMGDRNESGMLLKVSLLKESDA